MYPGPTSTTAGSLIDVIVQLKRIADILEKQQKDREGEEIDWKRRADEIRAQYAAWSKA